MFVLQQPFKLKKKETVELRKAIKRRINVFSELELKLCVVFFI